MNSIEWSRNTGNDSGEMITMILPEGFTWINKPCVVSSEDFSYKATCLCSFPKRSGKVRYIVEDNGRLFIQRKEQITFCQVTHYVHFNGSAHFVKSAEFFEAQNGLIEHWGQAWRPVVAASDYEARILSEHMNWPLPKKNIPRALEGMGPEHD